MATISTNHSTLPGGYYTDNHHTDPTGVAASDVSAAKVDRFYIELDGTPGGGGQMIATGSMTFTDGGTIESNATVDAEMNDWGGGYSFDPSSGHLEIMTDDGLGDMSLTVGGVTTNTPGDAAAALDPNDVSLAYGYVPQSAFDVRQSR